MGKPSEILQKEIYSCRLFRSLSHLKGKQDPTRKTVVKLTFPRVGVQTVRTTTGILREWKFKILDRSCTIPAVLALTTRTFRKLKPKALDWRLEKTMTRDLIQMAQFN